MEEEDTNNQRLNNGVKVEMVKIWNEGIDAVVVVVVDRYWNKCRRERAECSRRPKCL